jgi:ubiquinone/menaquinone biosynthesis C-methylase UbiE
MAQENFLGNPMPDIIEQWRYYFSVLQPKPGDTIIDIGCNTGDADFRLIKEYPEVKKVVGIDNNENRIKAALGKWQKEGNPVYLEFRLADAMELPFPDNYFNRGFCVDTLEWIKDPHIALQEMRRVIKPGGIFVVIHSDFDTQIFHTSDKQLNRKIVHAFSDSGPNGQIGRELVGLCREAGFTNAHPSIYALINTEWKSNLYAYKVAHMMVEWPMPTSDVSKNELNSWLEDIETQNSLGRFFYSINRNLCYCEK